MVPVNGFGIGAPSITEPVRAADSTSVAAADGSSAATPGEPVASSGDRISNRSKAVTPEPRLQYHLRSVIRPAGLVVRMSSNTRVRPTQTSIRSSATASTLPLGAAYDMGLPEL